MNVVRGYQKRLVERIRSKQTQESSRCRHLAQFACLDWRKALAGERWNEKRCLDPRPVTEGDLSTTRAHAVAPCHYTTDTHRMVRRHARSCTSIQLGPGACV